MQETVGLEIRKVNSFSRREAVGFEGRAAHGSGVGAEIRGWRSREETRWRQVEPGVIEAGWKMSGILLSWQNPSTFGTPEKPSSLRRKLCSVSESGYLLTDGIWKIDSVSKSSFLLTAGLWKIGSVSKSRFLLTDGP